MTPAIISMVLDDERDVVLARQRARQVAARVGFELQDQIRIATAVSEIARNAVAYGGGGRVEFRLEGTTAPQLLVVRVADQGPGIADLPALMDGSYGAIPGGPEVGVAGARRLVDQCEIDSELGRGTTVLLKRLLPPRSTVLGAAAIAQIGRELVAQVPGGAFEELQRQNQELLRALAEIERRQEELGALNRELEDTNRGVVALYAELDEKADHLRRADELKSRFLSNMSHEFRTPVNSIQALARILLDRTDGELTPEQERQVTFIRKTADALGDLVNDLLDLAKVEAGKTLVRPVEFDATHLFGVLRGMLRPLLASQSVALVFDEPRDLPPLYTDEGKVSQILRNFISNALKFTERGEVRVTARPVGGRAVAFAVSDTGIGIAPEDHERIFQEFTQIDSPLQRHVKGTGLGLALCRKLAELLGGQVTVESAPGRGSTFTATIPAIHELPAPVRPDWTVDPDRLPVLILEDSAETILLYEKMLDPAGFQVLPARNLREAREALTAFRPRAIILDIILRGEESWAFLTELKRRPDWRGVPVAVVSTVDDQAKALALGADAYRLKPLDRQDLLQMITRLAAPERLRRVLLVDDEEVFRYVLRQHLVTAHYLISEASSGAEALRRARAEHFDVICLDLTLPDLDGMEILRRLKADPATGAIPVVVVSSRILSTAERQALAALATDVVAKDTVAREGALAAVEAALRATGGAA